MVITRFLSSLLVLGSLLGSLSTYTMGGRFTTFPKGRLFAAALGGGYLGVQSTMHKQKRQSSYFPEYTDYNHPFDLNKRGLVHSLPKKIAAKPVTLAAANPDQIEEGGGSLLTGVLLCGGSLMAAHDSYVDTQGYTIDKFDEYNIQAILKKFPHLIVKKSENITQEEAAELTIQAASEFLAEHPEYIVVPSAKQMNKLAGRNAISSGFKTMTKGLLSIGVSKGIAFVADTDTETVDEVGEFVSAEVDKNAIGDEQERKALNMVSAGKLALKLGLVWLGYQGLKKLVTYATGYQCECPNLPTSVVGSGNFSKFVKYCIETGTRGWVKGLLASTIVMPLLSMTEPKKAPPVSDAEIAKMVNKGLAKKHKKQPVLTPAHAG